MNEAQLEAGDTELFLVVFALAEGKLAVEEFAAWLRARIPPLAGQQVQEPPAHYENSQAPSPRNPVRKTR